MDENGLPLPLKAQIAQALVRNRPDLAASVEFSDFVLECSIAGQARYVLLSKHTGSPSVICKMASGERTAQLLAEAHALRYLASTSPGIRDAVPQLIDVCKLGRRYLLVLPWIPGRSLLQFIRSDRNGMVMMNQAIDWLTKLHEATSRTRLFTENDYERLVNASVDRILRYVGPPSSLKQVLGQTQVFLRDLVGSELPFVMQHGDYEFGNLLLGPDGRLTVIDWELANECGPPLLDLAHLLIAYAVYRRRLPYGQAVCNAFIDQGEYSKYVDSRIEAYCNAIALPVELRNYLLVLCILGDAAQWAQRAQSEVVSDWWWWHLGVLTDIIVKTPSPVGLRPTPKRPRQ